MTGNHIAVIPARGGSKRIKNKNIKHFAGKPLIAYSLKAAVESKLFSDIVVSTDSEDIADVATEYGATMIITRPAELADDFTGTSPVVRHAISHYEQTQNTVDLVCCIYATAPFLNAEFLRVGYQNLITSIKKQFAFSVTTFDFPIQRALKMHENGVVAVDKQAIGKRSQDLEECFHDAGQFYWGRKQAWLDSLGMFQVHSSPVVIPRYLVQDIDTEEDWIRAELMYRAYVASQQMSIKSL